MFSFNQQFFYVLKQQSLNVKCKKISQYILSQRLNNLCLLIALLFLNNDLHILSLGDYVTHVIPLMTQPFDFRKRKSVVPRWEELLLFNEDFDYFMSYGTNLVNNSTTIMAYSPIHTWYTCTNTHSHTQEHMHRRTETQKSKHRRADTQTDAHMYRHTKEQTLTLTVQEHS